MVFGIAKDRPAGGRFWWTPAGWTERGVAFADVARAQKQAERLRERGHPCVVEEAPDCWPLYDGRLLQRARRDSTMVGSDVRLRPDLVPAPPTVRQMPDAKLRRAVEADWKTGHGRAVQADARLAGASDPDDPAVHHLLIEHLRQSRPKCVLRPQLWAAYAALHAEARRGLLPAYLPYELHDDDPVESGEKDRREGPDLPYVPEPADWKRRLQREREDARRLGSAVLSSPFRIFADLFFGRRR